MCVTIPQEKKDTRKEMKPKIHIFRSILCIKITIGRKLCVYGPVVVAIKREPLAIFNRFNICVLIFSKFILKSLKVK